MPAVDDAYTKVLLAYTEACATVLVNAEAGEPTLCRQILRASIANVKREGSKLIASLSDDQAEVVRRTLANAVTTNREVEKALAAWENGDRSAIGTLATRLANDSGESVREQGSERQGSADDEKRERDRRSRQRTREQEEQRQADEEQQRKAEHARRQKLDDTPVASIKVRMVVVLICGCICVCMNFTIMRWLHWPSFISFLITWPIVLIVCHRRGINLYR